MKTLLALTVVMLITVPVAHAQESCTAQSQAKKLSGAAQTSFLTRCHSDAEAMCNQAAADRKLSGAAKTSFLGKCVTDAK